MDLPAPQAQLDFLKNTQRLLSEGTFTATYKYALLLALADTCVERGEDTGAPFQVQTSWLAEKFITYYWRQAKPYVSSIVSAEPLLLRQNTGQQAAVLSAIKQLTDAGVSLSELQRSPKKWTGLVGEIARIVRVMPLWKLQVIGNRPLEFLYRHTGDGHAVELEPGVMYCFRHFHGLIIDLVRGAWVRYVRRHNEKTLGSAADLDQFLFGSERASLNVYGPILREVQEGRCFYCERAVTLNVEKAHIDHFIPWSQYPVDLGHNFVLAHGSCNLAKSDHLAAVPHLAKWEERNRVANPFLEERFTKADAIYDLQSSRKIVRWAYGQAAAIQALTWIKGDQMQPLSNAWFNVLERTAA